MPPAFIGIFVLVAFMAMVLGGIAFAAPILKAASERIAGRIGAPDAGPVSSRDIARLQEAVQDLERQLHTLQEQHTFLEQLIAGGQREALPPGDSASHTRVEPHSK